jgi:hypothetical protein
MASGLICTTLILGEAAHDSDARSMACVRHRENRNSRQGELEAIREPVRMPVFNLSLNMENHSG